jgi:hypothetical protein
MEMPLRTMLWTTMTCWILLVTPGRPGHWEHGADISQVSNGHARSQPVITADLA